MKPKLSYQTLQYGLASSPLSDTVAGLDPELGSGGWREFVRQLVLLGLVTDQLLPLPLTLVPLQLVPGDGGAVVLGGVPAQGQRVFGPVGDLGWEGLGRHSSRNVEGSICGICQCEIMMVWLF